VKIYNLKIKKLSQIWFLLAECAIIYLIEHTFKSTAYIMWAKRKKYSHELYLGIFTL